MSTKQRRNRRRFAAFVAAGVVAAAGASLYLANPYRITIQTSTASETVHLAPPGQEAGVGLCETAADDPVCGSQYTGYASATADRDAVYVGEPVWITLQTSRATMDWGRPGENITEAPGHPSPAVEIEPVAGAVMVAARPVLTLENHFGPGWDYIDGGYWTITPAGTSPALAALPPTANPGEDVTVVWALTFARPGTYQVPIRLGGAEGVTRSIAIRVLPDPAGYRNVSYLRGTDAIPLWVTWDSNPGFTGAAGSAVWTIDAQTTAATLHQSGTIEPGGAERYNLPVATQDAGTAEVHFTLAPGSTGYPTIRVAGIGVAQAPDLAQVEMTHSTTQARWLLSVLGGPGAVTWPWGSRPRDWRWLVGAASLAAAALALAPWRRRRRAGTGNVQMETTEPEAEEAPAAALETEKDPEGGDA